MRNPIILYLRASAGYLWLIPAAAYLAFSAGQIALRNYASQQEVAELRQRLAQARRERQRLEALVIYYQTDAFKEKELRRALLLVRPDEKVYALPESSKVRPLEEDVISEATTDSKANEANKLPYWRQWVAYILH